MCRVRIEMLLSRARGKRRTLPHGLPMRQGVLAHSTPLGAVPFGAIPPARRSSARGDDRRRRDAELGVVDLRQQRQLDRIDRGRDRMKVFGWSSRESLRRRSFGFCQGPDKRRAPDAGATRTPELPQACTSLQALAAGTCAPSLRCSRACARAASAQISPETTTAIGTICSACPKDVASDIAPIRNGENTSPRI